MPKIYELTFIVHPDLTEDERNQVVERVEGWIAAEDGEIIEASDWGRRRLEYPIQKQLEGYYTFMLVRLQPSVIAELERNMKIAEDILRFLVVHQVKPKKKKIAASE